MTLGQRIRQLRELKRWRQVDLGKLLGVTGSAVTQWERGQRVPDPAMLERIADVFEVSVDYLLGRSAPRDFLVAEAPASDYAQPLYRLPRLRVLRTQAGLTTQQLSDLSGVPRRIIEDCENGDLACSGYDMVRLATALNVSSSFLAGRSNDRTIKSQLPPELEQLVNDVLDGKVTVEDIRRGVRMLQIARGEENSEP